MRIEITIRRLILIIFIGISSFQQVAAKVKYTVRLAADSVTYQVYLRPDLSYAAPLNTTNSAQVTLVVPKGGFVVSSFVSVKGNWKNNVTVKSPVENPNFDYFVFALTGSTTLFNYTAGVEILVFTFQNKGICTGKMTIIEKTDPFYPPNTANVASGNQIGFFGGGPSNSWSGNYESGDADCSTTTIQCKDKWDDSLLPDTLASCGGLAIQTKINSLRTDSISWSPNIGISCINCNTPTFAAPTNRLYNLKIPAGNGCFLMDTIRVLSAPNPTFSLVATDPKTCASKDGRIVVNLDNTSLKVQYSLQSNSNYQSSNIFSNLPKGDYRIYARTIPYNCIDSELVTLKCDSIINPPPAKLYSKISGIAFFDCSNHGIFDSNESGLSNITVTLNGKDSLNNIINRTLVTKSQGKYTFDSIPSGNYIITFQPHNQLSFSPKNIGNNPLFDSDVDTLSGKTDNIIVSWNQNITGINAGYRDILAPVITPIHPLLANIPNEGTINIECSSTVLFSEKDAVVTDNYDPNVKITFLEGVTLFGDCSLGYIMKMRCGFRSTDNCGNSSEFWFNIIISDKTAPILHNIPKDTVINDTSKLPLVPFVNATDNCTDSVQVTLESKWEVILCDSVLVRKWTATDSCGNKTIAQQRISYKFCNCSNPIIVDSIITENSYCQDKKGTLSLYTKNNPNLYTFSITPNNGLQNGNKWTDLKSGIYSLEIIDRSNNDCSFKKDITISDTCYCILPVVKKIITANDSCNNSIGSISIQMELAAANYKFIWYPELGVSSNNNSVRTGLPAGNYIVTVKKLSDTTCYIPLKIDIINQTNICNVVNNDTTIINASNHGFSPNNDGRNDYLSLPELFNLQSFTLTIYNRWGNKLFKTTTNETLWDGSWEGNPVPDGIYYMVLEVPGKPTVAKYIQLLR